MDLQRARVYDVGAKGSNDYRVLVDRLWPRGIKKEALELDEWLKKIAPSNELRTWFGHEVARWPEFKRRYTEELEQHADELSRLGTLARAKRVTLLYSARDTEHNQAVVVAEAIEKAG